MKNTVKYLVKLTYRYITTTDSEGEKYQVKTSEVINRSVKYRTDSRSLPRGGDYMFISGVDTKYPKIELDEEENLVIVEDMVESEAQEYKVKRQKSYPKVGDQLDCIFKMVKHLKKNGLDIGESGDMFVGMIDSVKTRHPKPGKK